MCGGFRRFRLGRIFTLVVLATAVALFGSAGGGSSVSRASFTGTITPGGPAVTVTIATAGENASLTFSGAQGQRVSLLLANGTFSPYNCQASLTIYKPDNSVLVAASPCIYGPGNGFMDVQTLPVSGTYTIVFDPYSSNTGNVTLTLYDVPPDPAPVMTPSTGGDARAFTINPPGLNLRPTFAGTAGQRVSVLLTNGSLSPYNCQASLTLLKPDGTTLASANPCIYGPGNGFMDVQTLPVSGTYTIVFDPYSSNTGNVTLTLYDVPPDPAPTLVVDGPSVPITFSPPGLNARPTFSGRAGQPISIKLTNGSLSPYNCQASLTLLKPDGTTLASANPCIYGPGNGTLNIASLPVNGTYTIVFDPYSSNTGSVTFAVAQNGPWQPLEQTFGTVDDCVGIHGLAGCGSLSDPVNTLTGAFTYAAADLSLSGTGVPFGWSRSYTSPLCQARVRQFLLLDY